MHRIPPPRSDRKKVQTEQGLVPPDALPRAGVLLAASLFLVVPKMEQTPAVVTLVCRESQQSQESQESKGSKESQDRQGSTVRDTASLSGASASIAEYSDATSNELRSRASRAAPTQRTSLERRAIEHDLRNLVHAGIAPSGDAPKQVSMSARRQALLALASLQSPVELEAALKVLDGEGSRPNLVVSEPEVRHAIFRALARDPGFGQPALIGFAVTGDDQTRNRALDALPETLSDAAVARLVGLLGSQRELYINRAASIASAHAAAPLIPALAQAQYAPPREKRGDEAWIAIGNTQRYVQNQIPIVGDASTSFQPVIGTIYEGSLLRIMESVVEIYRTEVHLSLEMVAEQLTGQPAPPLGYDSDRWLAWYRDEFPALAARHALEREQDRNESDANSTVPARDL